VLLVINHTRNYSVTCCRIIIVSSWINSTNSKIIIEGRASQTYFVKGDQISKKKVLYALASRVGCGQVSFISEYAMLQFFHIGAALIYAEY
jgi:hypothetical protein